MRGPLETRFSVGHSLFWEVEISKIQIAPNKRKDAAHIAYIQSFSLEK